MIKNLIIITSCALFLLAGCAVTKQSAYQNFKAGKPLSNLPYKTGATQKTLNRDSTDCQVEAVQKVPQHQILHSTPSFKTNTQTYCNNIGGQVLCNTTGGQTIGGNTYTEDANSGLRNKVFYQCMADKNYRYVNLQPCPEGANIGHKNAGLPPLSKTTCYRVNASQFTEVGNY